ncbi:PepSY domain-containing protein [Amphritea japonica]|uniref:PepSY domain-containing protein n=1 Tax=Amphritea japonica ATCC BAA-1530 TaxID=1278309 RepID=A0A7R6PEA3_9GAMM|nr:PepSY domain-containing protein [Amphritea japonica]BBB24792.1 conserved hypothetical protein [Amphritea japonica ATCC BAA-1530]
MLRAFSQTLLVLLVMSAAGTAAAARLPVELMPESRSESMVLAGNTVSLQQAAASVKQSHGGKVVKAETRTRGGRQVHHIRLIKTGRVKTVLIDAATGQEVSP